MPSKHQLRKNLRYGDKAVYFEALHEKVTKWTPYFAGKALRSSLNNQHVNLSRDFVGHVAERHPQDAQHIQCMIEEAWNKEIKPPAGVANKTRRAL